MVSASVQSNGSVITSVENKKSQIHYQFLGVSLKDRSLDPLFLIFINELAEAVKSYDNTDDEADIIIYTDDNIANAADCDPAQLD